MAPLGLVRIVERTCDPSSKLHLIFLTATEGCLGIGEMDTFLRALGWLPSDLSTLRTMIAYLFYWRCGRGESLPHDYDVCLLKGMLRMSRRFSHTTVSMYRISSQGPRTRTWHRSAISTARWRSHSHFNMKVGIYRNSQHPYLRTWLGRTQAF